MGLLNLFRKAEPDDFEMRADFVSLVMRRLTDRQNRIRAEDAICGAAAIVGERCIDAAGEFPLRDHKIIPGKRVFSDRINELLCGDQPGSEIGNLLPESVYGILRAALSKETYPAEAYPTLVSIFSGYAAGVGKVEDWGKIPVTVLLHNHPTIVPLRFAYETRGKVDAIFSPIAADKMRCLAIATKSLAALLDHMSGAVPPDVALRLAFEIINGMAKTAPMTTEAFLAGSLPKS